MRFTVRSVYRLFISRHLEEKKIKINYFNFSFTLLISFWTTFLIYGVFVTGQLQLKLNRFIGNSLWCLELKRESFRPLPPLPPKHQDSQVFLLSHCRKGNIERCWVILPPSLKFVKPSVRNLWHIYCWNIMQSCDPDIDLTSWSWNSVRSCFWYGQIGY